MDPNLSNLLKWSLANSTPTTDPSTTNAPPPPTTNPALPTSTPSALAALLSASGSTDADHMRSSLTTITGPTTPATPLSSKLTAFTDLHYLLESLDNANNLSPLHLWPPLVAQLHSPEPEIRRMAAACVGTAVQNNAIAQESLLAQNAIPTLVRMAMEDADEGVRRKAIYALSSAMRNYQPATDQVVEALPGGVVVGGGGGDGRKVGAGDMEAIDGIMERLREGSRKRETT